MLIHFYFLCAKDGPERQAGERDCSRSDGLLSAGENLQCVLRRAGREILLPRAPLPGKTYTLMTETWRYNEIVRALSKTRKMMALKGTQILCFESHLNSTLVLSFFLLG